MNWAERSMAFPGVLNSVVLVFKTLHNEHDRLVHRARFLVSYVAAQRDACRESCVIHHFHRVREISRENTIPFNFIVIS